MAFQGCHVRPQPHEGWCRAWTSSYQLHFFCRLHNIISVYNIIYIYISMCVYKLIDICKIHVYIFMIIIVIVIVITTGTITNV